MNGEHTHEPLVCVRVRTSAPIPSQGPRGAGPLDRRPGDAQVLGCPPTPSERGLAAVVIGSTLLDLRFFFFAKVGIVSAKILQHFPPKRRLHTS